MRYSYGDNNLMLGKLFLNLFDLCPKVLANRMISRPERLPHLFGKKAGWHHNAVFDLKDYRLLTKNSKI